MRKIKSIFEKMGGTYTKVGDYYIPNLALPEDEEEKTLRKYGMLRRTYLEEHRKAQYNHLVLTSELFSHLYDIDEQAQQMLDAMTPKLKKQQGVTEELKGTNQMVWVGRINNIIAQIEEIIFSEIVYV